MAKKDPKEDAKTIVEMDPNARLELLLTRFLEEGRSSGLSGDQLEAILAKVGTSSAEAMHKAVRPENDVHPHISAYSYPEGDIARPKPALVTPGSNPFKPTEKTRRTVYFNYHKEDPDMLTPTEIEAYNSIAEDCDARGGQYTARIENKGRELHIVLKSVNHLDQRMNLPPSLLMLIHELKTGQKMESLEEALSEIAKLREELATYRDEPKRPVVRRVTADDDTPRGLAPVRGGTVADLEKALLDTPSEQL